MKRILVLDNYDSFTYNLVHLLEEIGGAQLDVIRNDKLTVQDAQPYDKILLSPGPGVPRDAGIMPALIKAHAPHKSILGVCLGHQAIAEAFGGELLNMTEVIHGKGTPIHLLDPIDPLFDGIDNPFIGGRYHSWLVKRDPLPSCLRVTAQDAQQKIMALSHTKYDVKGIQFHPESVLTPCGRQLLKNWMGH